MGKENQYANNLSIKFAWKNIKQMEQQLTSYKINIFTFNKIKKWNFALKLKIGKWFYNWNNLSFENIVF